MADSNIFRITKSEFLHSVQMMMEENEILGVKQKTPGFIFERLFSPEELRLDYDISLLPPNRYFIPSKESLIKFNLISKISHASETAIRPCIILGIHPYDLHAIKILDAVYTGNVVDTNYLIRRKAALIIGVDCLNPWPYSFAASMKTAMPPRLFDLWLSDLGDNYLIEVGSVKGNGLLRRYFKTASVAEAQIEQRDVQRKESLLRYKLALDFPPEKIPEVLDKSWQNVMWTELGQKCFSCGSCTMVCPTCVCFEVQDKVDLNLQNGERWRHWDSCMFAGFARIASGEEFRPGGTERLRHRLYRKGKYMLERWGESGCVGCGRCIHACLVDIASPVYAYNRLAKEAQ
jgi:ferredoxin